MLNTSPTASVAQLRNDVELPTIQSKAILLQLYDVIQSDIALHLQAHKNGWYLSDALRDATTHILERFQYGPRRDKTCLRGFRQSKTQTSLLSYSD